MVYKMAYFLTPLHKSYTYNFSHSELSHINEHFTSVNISLLPDSGLSHLHVSIHLTLSMSYFCPVPRGGH